jgi:hypothetical protein
VCYSLLSHARGGIEELSAHLSVGASAHVTRLGCWRNGFKLLSRVIILLYITHIKKGTPIITRQVCVEERGQPI